MEVDIAAAKAAGHTSKSGAAEYYFCSDKCNRDFDDVESDLQRNWAGNRGTSTLDWDRARPAARDSWQRVSDAIERATPGDSDHDGK